MQNQNNAPMMRGKKNLTDIDVHGVLNTKKIVIMMMKT